MIFFMRIDTHACTPSGMHAHTHVSMSTHGNKTPGPKKDLEHQVARKRHGHNPLSRVPCENGVTQMFNTWVWSLPEWLQTITAMLTAAQISPPPSRSLGMPPQAVGSCSRAL